MLRNIHHYRKCKDIQDAVVQLLMHPTSCWIRTMDVLQKRFVQIYSRAVTRLVDTCYDMNVQIFLPYCHNRALWLGCQHMKTIGHLQTQQVQLLKHTIFGSTCSEPQRDVTDNRVLFCASWYVVPPMRIVFHWVFTANLGTAAVSDTKGIFSVVGVGIHPWFTRAVSSKWQQRLSEVFPGSNLFSS